MRQREQDGKEPDIDSEDEESKTDEATNDEDEETKNKNFMTRLYEDENFVREKTLLEEQLVKATEAT